MVDGPLILPVQLRSSLIWQPIITTRAAVIEFLFQNIQPFIFTVRDCIAAGISFIQGFSEKLIFYVSSLQSLPWNEYYGQAANIVNSIESHFASLEGLFSNAGWPKPGYGVHILA